MRRTRGRGEVEDTICDAKQNGPVLFMAFPTVVAKTHGAIEQDDGLDEMLQNVVVCHERAAGKEAAPSDRVLEHNHQRSHVRHRLQIPRHLLFLAAWIGCRIGAHTRNGDCALKYPTSTRRPDGRGLRTLPLRDPISLSDTEAQLSASDGSTERASKSRMHV